jgi:hypothetical protein
MHDYEIRILNSKRSSLALIEVQEPGDDAAIRSAGRIANGRPVEVWQGIDCIYRSDALANGMRPAA